MNLTSRVNDETTCWRFRINSWPSDEMSLTYVESGPSQPPTAFIAEVSSAAWSILFSALEGFNWQLAAEKS